MQNYFPFGHYSRGFDSPQQYAELKGEFFDRAQHERNKMHERALTQKELETAWLKHIMGKNFIPYCRVRAHKEKPKPTEKKGKLVKKRKPLL
jgi:hypothetical protein